MTLLERLFAAFAFPVGFFLGLTAYAMTQLAGLPGGFIISAILLIGFSAIFFADWVLDKIFGRFMHSGVFGPVDPVAKRKLERSERRVSRLSWKFGAVGGVLGVLACAIWSPGEVLTYTAPLIDWL